MIVTILFYLFIQFSFFQNNIDLEFKPEMSYHIEYLQDDIDVSFLDFLTEHFFLGRSNTIIENTLSNVVKWDRKLINHETIYVSLFNGQIFLRNTEKLIYKSKRLPSKSDLVKRYLWIVFDLIKMKIMVTIAGTVEE